MNAADSCASDRALHNYLRGDLAPDEEAAVRRHLEGCRNCRDRLEERAGVNEWWREARALVADFDAPPEPPLPAADQEREETQAKILLAQVSPWLGPTDDPTKLGRVGGYEVLGIVGAGGAGIVLKAFDGRLNRLVALKVLLPSLTHHAGARRRFEREARAAAAVVHPNVVPIFAVDTFRGHPYLAMQYVGGRSLQQRLDAEGPLAPLEAIRLAAQIARGLAAAHAQGVIHRDIKPANILLEQTVDRAYVTDFGLARVADDASTHSGALAGTPSYMSPEQCQGMALDTRSDLFSLGSLIYAMCGGRPPFRAETVLGTLRKVCESTPRNLRELQPDTPEWLAGLVERLMEKSPEHRLLSAAEVAEILDQELQYAQNPAATAIPRRPWLPAPARCAPRQRRAFVGLAGALVLVAALWGLHAARQGASEAKPPARQQPLVAISTSVDESGQPRYVTEERQTFAAKDFDALLVFASQAHVVVRGERTEKIRVLFRLAATGAKDASAARALFEQHRLGVQTAGRKLVLRSGDGRSTDLPAGHSLDVAIEAVVPEALAVEIALKRGTAISSALTGPVSATVDTGDLLFENCHARIFAAVREQGRVRLHKSTGDVIASTPTGEVELDEFRGNLIQTKSSP